MLERRIFPLAICLLALLATAVPAESQTKLLRFPALHGDSVVFTYGGDLWRASTDGGLATRLTAHPGLELFARFSPDGKWIAFTGQYDGDEQVYVIPAEGGEPKQLTFYPARGPLTPRWGYDNQVYGWTPDGKSVLFRSLRDSWDLGDSKLFTVAVDGGLPKALPMPESGAGDLSPDGTKVVYSPLARDFRHWKRYQGGWAQELYIFDLATNAQQRVTDNIRADRDPMWIGNKIYFASDRDGTLNLYVYDIPSASTTELTHSKEWDLRWPSADRASGRIVYELDGELHIYDTAAATDRKLSIEVPTDGVARRPRRISVADTIESFGLAPKGQRALFAARGDIFTVPIEHGPTRNLTRSSGAHDRSPEWSPDGTKIAFISDRDGEDEVYLIDQDGYGEPQQLTDGNTTRFDNLLWAPDGKHLALRDQRSKVFVLDVASKELLEVADDGSAFGLDYTWSPDGGFLAFSLEDPNNFRSLYIWSVAERKLRRITGEQFNEFNPTWDPEGKYLFYLSNREYLPQLSGIEFDYATNRQTKIYALALRRDVPNPFPVRSDEVKPEEGDKARAPVAEAAKGKKKGAKAEAEPAKDDSKAQEPLRIDFDGLAERVTTVPLPADNYSGLEAVKGHLLYGVFAASYYGRASEHQPELRIYSIEDRKETTLAEGVQGLAFSPDGSKLMIAQGGKYQVLDATPAGKDGGKSVSTEGLQVDLVPAEEWAQIFNEVWRRYRDFFYVENMHGYDWPALREQYKPLLAYVAHRSDLNYVISEMIAELSTSHSYIAGGDYEMPERPHAALLGARFELDQGAGRYRITNIFEGQNAESTYRSPLTEVGVDVHAGDYLLEVNGQELRGDDNPFRLLRHAGESPVELLVNSKPTMAGARRVMVNPIDSETELIYLRWIEGNIQYVTERSGGKLGYVHIPDMGPDGLREFIKWFYPQVRKQGLVVDVRNNGGGNISSMLMERLQRKLLMFDFERNTDNYDPYPPVVFHGHMVCLLDEDTASDGDQFAWVFRKAGLGPLIGKRSWGGVVGIYGRPSLIDGGSVSVPESGSTDAEGNWVIEGHGVDPDIVVENEPAELLKGRDQQLEKAVDVLLEKLQEQPMDLPPRPSAPVKTQAAIEAAGGGGR